MRQKTFKRNKITTLTAETNVNNSNQVVAHLNLGLHMLELEMPEQAISAFETALKLDPLNSAILANLGASYLRVGKLSHAKQVLEKALEINPNEFAARINLGTIFQANKDYHGCLSNALEAVALNPTSALAFNNLGCAFGLVNMPNEALHAYETANKLDSNYHEAQLNTAISLVELGRDAEAYSLYENLIQKIPKNNFNLLEVTKFFMSILLLEYGDLKRGWEYYDSGFNTKIPINARRSPQRNFKFPLWKGQDLKGKKILIWREQGIGDELLFSSCIPDLISLGYDITLECSTRLVETFQRSFPEITVRSEGFNLNDGYILKDQYFDYHIPLGSLPRILRSSITNFENKKPFILVDEIKKNKFQERLSNFNDKKLIGICWRSGVLDPLRNSDYTALNDWASIVSLEGYQFVNLQYGDCENEIQNLERKLKISVLRWKDLDLKNDLDDVFALMSCLDGVITVATAVNCMAGSLGIPTICIDKRGWPVLGMHSGLNPWHPNTFYLEYNAPNEIATDKLVEIPNLLKSLFPNINATTADIADSN